MGGVGVVHRPEPGFVCEWGEPEEMEASPPAGEVDAPVEPAGERLDPAGERRSPHREGIAGEEWMAGEPMF